MRWLDWLASLFAPKPKRALIDIGLLRAVASSSHTAHLEQALPALISACQEFEIETPARLAAFLAQTAHESLGFSRTEEMSSGAQYEGRRDLGNLYPGDGVAFKGAGYIQITGRWNASAVADYFEVPLDEVVAWMRTPNGAARSAAHYWSVRGLNRFADQLTMTAYDQITKAINGGFNGKGDRDRRYRAACAYLGLTIRS